MNKHSAWPLSRILHQGSGLVLSIHQGNLSSTVIYDGVRVHPLVNYAWGRHAFSFVLAFANKPGFSYSISF